MLQAPEASAAAASAFCCFRYELSRMMYGFGNRAHFIAFLPAKGD